MVAQQTETTQDITIDPEFKALVPALSDAEFAQLEANILTDGCRDPLVVWHETNTLVDGHNRYEICTRHGIPFSVAYHEFDCREAVTVWMLENQLGRRNVPEPARVECALKLKPAMAKLAELRMRAGVQDPRANWREGRTDEQLAEKTGISARKLLRAETVLTKAPAFVANWYRAGDISAYAGEQLYKELLNADDAVLSVCAAHQVTDYNTVPLLIKLYENGRDTWKEIEASGWIQPGEEHDAVHVSEPFIRVQAALKLKAKTHKDIALDVLLTSETPEWYTPPHIVELVRQTLESIELDPASNASANGTVGAARFYSAEDDGLNQSWNAETLYLNPPYGDTIDQWIERLVEEYEAGNIGAAITLIPARTDTGWFRRLRDYPRCFVNGRIKFVSPEGTENSAPFPSVVVYLGTDMLRFYGAFHALGDIYTRYQPS